MQYLLVIVLFLALAIAPVHAQDETTETEPDTTAQDDDSAAQPAAAPPARAEETQTESRRARPQKFEPSEDISEDMSVSFPVDI